MLGRRPRRASLYFLLLVVVISLCGALYLWRGVTSQTVYAAAVDLPAFHQISQADVRAVEMRSSDIPDHSVSERTTLLGRYTLGSIEQDKPFTQKDLGPQLAPGAISERRLTGFGVAIADVQGLVARGDTVDVFVSSVGAADAGVVIHDVIVLDMKDDEPSGKRTLLCAVSKAEEKNLLRIFRDSRIFIVRATAQSSF